MPLSLYNAFVPSCLQILGSVRTLIAKAEAHCADNNIDPKEWIEARLAPDMLDLAYQVKSCGVHSAGAIAGVAAGNFSPDMTTPPDSFAGLKDNIDKAVASLEALSESDVEALSDKSMTFTIGDKLRWDFAGADFLLSFSQPNFYFHATTAYDLLRMKGLPIGKADYLGALRMKA